MELIRRENLVTTCATCGHEADEHAMRTISQPCFHSSDGKPCGCQRFIPSEPLPMASPDE